MNNRVIKVCDLFYATNHGCKVKIINYDDERDFIILSRGLNHYKELGRFAEWRVSNVDITNNVLEIECEPI